MSNSASNAPLVIAGDIGGTQARFRLSRGDATATVDIIEHSFLVADFATIDDALASFLALAASVTDAPIEAACLAIAAPISGGRAKLTNAAWIIDAAAIAERFRIPRIALVNDFYAAAAGIAGLRPDDLQPLQIAPAEREGPRLVIGPGTGLGVAYALPRDGNFQIVAGEGGHVGFAPADDEQIELLRHLWPVLGRVSAEHLVSGAGIVRLYAFACRSEHASVPEDVALEGAAAVARRAAQGEIAATHALELFASMLGAVSGDHALSVLAMGGVYIAGGVTPRLAQQFRRESFLASFRAKAPHAALMQRMPVWLVLDEHLGLSGAAHLAVREALRGNGGEQHGG